MNENLFETIEKSCGVLQLPFSAKEFAQLAEEHALSAEAAQAVALQPVTIEKSKDLPEL